MSHPCSVDANGSNLEDNVNVTKDGVDIDSYDDFDTDRLGQGKPTPCLGRIARRGMAYIAYSFGAACIWREVPVVDCDAEKAGE